MSAPKRQRLEPTDDWQQLHLLLNWPEQVLYELIRPVVLFGRSPAARAKDTGVTSIRPRIQIVGAFRLPCAS